VTLAARRALSLASESLDAARQDLIARTREGRGGAPAVAAFAGRVDDLLRSLVASAPAPARPAALIALGGYGRRQLCLHSDVDLLVLFDGPLGPADEEFVRGLFNPLWDLKLTLGHQVREIADFRQVETDNPEFVLALVDARLVAGDRDLFDRFSAAFNRPETHAFAVRALQDLIAERHARFNDTLYQLEPDIKDAPGALRDLMALRVIARLSDPALLDGAAAEAGRLEEAEDFLLQLRSILHLESRRNQNVLTHDLQEHAALLLRCAGGTPQQRVEHLMSDYFRHARSVARALERVRRAAPAPVGVNLVRGPEGVRFVDLARAQEEPSRWVAVFQAALDAGAGVADSTLAWIQQHVDRLGPDAFVASAGDRAALLRLLKPRPGLYARLSEMHDCGLLGRIFPEFQSIAWRVVRDFYHKYTVDEHTLLTIRNLERLTDPDSSSPDRFRSLVRELDAPELLVLALVYHDVGKWRDDDHVEESLRMADAMMDRLQLAPDARDTVAFLIRHHIAMSLVAFRRDTEDPAIVRQFASLVGTEERLKMLCLLTLADVGAVSPDTLTPWREELLWRLYIDTYNQLTLKYADDLIEQNQAGLRDLLDQRPSDLSDAEIRRFLEGLPRRYLQRFPPSTIFRHVRLSRDIGPGQVHATLEPKDGAWELTVVTLDRTFLFSNICGVLSSFGMDILRGHALTNANGFVLDTFEFLDRERFFGLNEDGRHQFLDVLEAAVSGRLDIAARLRSRERGVFGRGTARIAPTVHCDNEASERYTILDIIATNAVGLLHRVSRVMSRHGCDVHLVLISTEGERAVDVFHITQAGHKLSDAGQRALAADLARMLEGVDEAD
jgi:[protein-PII] uridylyltransferase